VRTFAVVNQKGGCGKTTTAINLAGVFAARGFRTLLVDMDPQGHCAAGLAIPEQRVDLNIGDAMLAPDDQPVDAQRLLWRVSRNLDLAPSTVRLAALEAARGELANRADAESRLKHVLQRFDHGYDACIIDCSPAIGLLAFNALVAADEIIIPVETGFFSMQGANKQVNAIKAIGKRLGVAPPHNLLATMHDVSSVLSQDLLDELRRRFNGRVLPVVIRSDQSLREAASFGQPVIEYAPESTGAKDYSALADHLIEHSIKGPKSRGSGDLLTPSLTPASTPANIQASRPISTTTVTQTITPSHGSLASSLMATKLAPVLDEDGLKTVAVVDLSGGAQPMRPVRGAKSLTAHASPTPEAEPKPSDVNTSKLNPTELMTKSRQLQRAAMMNESNGRAEQAHDAAVVRQAQAGETLTTQAAAKPVTAASAAVRPFGVTVENGVATFRQPASVGKSVAVAGDFNGWQPDRTPMRLNAALGIFEAIAPLGDKPAQYRIVIDGQWMPDAFNPFIAPNPFGGANSIASETHRQQAT
jgi:chromosome partitioning protein